MGAVFNKIGKFDKLRCQQDFLKVRFELVAGRDALPETGKLQFPLHHQKGFLRQIHQTADFVILLMSYRMRSGFPQSRAGRLKGYRHTPKISRLNMRNKGICFFRCRP